jgi:opine dehydrogenase
MGPVGEMSRAMHQRGDGTLGPKSLDTRYVLEDVPFGLVATERLGRLVGAPAILHESGINLFSAIYGHDFRAENDLLPALGFDRLTLSDLRALCRNGYDA